MQAKARPEAAGARGSHRSGVEWSGAGVSLDELGAAEGKGKSARRNRIEHASALPLPTALQTTARASIALGCPRPIPPLARGVHVGEAPKK